MLADRLRRALGIEPHQSIARAYLQTPQPRVDLLALCTTHAIQHTYHCAPDEMPVCQADWAAKHPQGICNTLFIVRKVSLPRRLFEHGIELFGRPWWYDYAHNADVKLAYASSGAFTIGLHSTPLASSSTFVAGRESTALSNTGGALYLNAAVGGKVTTGTSPTTGRLIRWYLYAAVDDTPTYPDVLDGTDSDETFTSADILQSATIFFQESGTDATTNRTYWFRPLHVAPFFGGALPANWGVFVAHNTDVGLSGTAGSHAISYKQNYATVI